MALIALAALALPLIALLLVAATSVESHLLNPDAVPGRRPASATPSPAVVPADPAASAVS